MTRALYVAEASRGRFDLEMAGMSPPYDYSVCQAVCSEHKMPQKVYFSPSQATMHWPPCGHPWTDGSPRRLERLAPTKQNLQFSLSTVRTAAVGIFKVFFNVSKSRANLPRVPRRETGFLTQAWGHRKVLCVSAKWWNKAPAPWLKMSVRCKVRQVGSSPKRYSCLAPSPASACAAPKLRAISPTATLERATTFQRVSHYVHLQRFPVTHTYFNAHTSSHYSTLATSVE